MFESELELQKEFIKQLNKHKQKNTYILDEFNARFGNVDIVKVKYTNKIPLNYKQIELLSNIGVAHIVGYLHKKSLRTLDYLIKNSGYTLEYTLNILSKLKSANIISEPYEKRYIINEQFIFPKIQFYSYELKLTDWQKAIIQALRNQTFSSYSYVVMPEKIAIRLFKTKEYLFKGYNIGLIAVNHRTFKTLIPCKISHQKFSKEAFISSSAKYLLLQKSF